MDEYIGLRATAGQRRAWEHAAKADHRKLTDWIRLQLDRAVVAQENETDSKKKIAR